MYGFLTRRVTDEVVKAFVSSVNGKLFHNTHKSEYINPYQKSNWIDFNKEEWIKNKNPIVVFGILRGAEELLWLCKQYDIDYYYIDHAYFFKSKHNNHPSFNDRFYRITKNNENINYLTNDKMNNFIKDRVTSFKRITSLSYNPYKKRGDNILVCPPSEFVSRYYKLQSVDHWINKTIEEIKKYSDRPIVIRHKKTERTLEQDLSNAHCIISFQSTAAIQAILKGIPSISDKCSCVYPISETDISKIEQLENLKEEDVNNLIENLLSNQFSLKEIKEGFAFKQIQKLQI